MQDINDNSKEFNMEEWHQVQQRRREILNQTCQKTGIKYIIKRFVFQLYFPKMCFLPCVYHCIFYIQIWFGDFT